MSELTRDLFLIGFLISGTVFFLAGLFRRKYRQDDELSNEALDQAEIQHERTEAMEVIVNQVIDNLDKVAAKNSMPQFDYELPKARHERRIERVESRFRREFGTKRRESLLDRFQRNVDNFKNGGQR